MYHYATETVWWLCHLSFIVAMFAVSWRVTR